MIGTEGWIRLVRESKEPKISLNLPNNEKNMLFLLWLLYETCIPKISNSSAVANDVADETVSPITLIQFIPFQKPNSAVSNSNKSSGDASLLKGIFQRQQQMESAAHARDKAATQIRHSSFRFGKM